jgi:hypothetical protein
MERIWTDPHMRKMLLDVHLLELPRTQYRNYCPDLEGEP